MKNIRIELQSHVISVNKYLREAVDNMDTITLLRNMHPIVREHYTHELLKDGIITREQAKEFIKIL